jgi:predicted DNA-binding transcriptional regulator AlpA
VDDLGTIGDIATLLQVSRSRADQISRQTGFPAPVGTLSGGRVWNMDHVREWAKSVGRITA